MKNSSSSTQMHSPPHVGEILREMYMEPLELSVTELANQLGVSRQALSRLVNERSGISADMGIRLSKAFETSPDYWVNLAKQYELWQAVLEYTAHDIKPYKYWQN